MHITSLGVQRDLFSMNVQQVPQGTGTGFLWDERGHIVTNFHVIQGGNGARVTLADQSSYEAELVGAFPDRDLAVLRIQAPQDKLLPIGIVPRLIRDGRFLRPTIGISAGNAALHRALDLPKGVALVQVLPGSPARR